MLVALSVANTPGAEKGLRSGVSQYHHPRLLAGEARFFAAGEREARFAAAGESDGRFAAAAVAAFAAAAGSAYPGRTAYTIDT